MRSLFLFLTRSEKTAKYFALIWTALIYLACLIPGRDVPEVDIPLIDKWVHFILFGTFAFLWLCTFGVPDFKKHILIFLAAVAVGYSVELLQGSGITSGRSYDMMDVVADSIGGALGVVTFYFMNRKYAVQR